ncbi:glycosyltransferase family 1 protein [Priestia endophytica]
MTDPTPIRILHVFGKLNAGGAETMLMNIYRNIDRSKIQFDFIVHTQEECFYDQEIKQLGGRIYRIPNFTGKNILSYISSWKQFFIVHPEYKIIHTHVRSTASIFLYLAKKHKVTTIAHSHSTSNGKGVSAIVKNLMQFPIRYLADHLVACSDNAAQWLFGKKIIKQKAVIILKNAIDTNKFIYNADIRKNQRSKLAVEDKFVLGHIGRFNEAKNHEFLIRTFSEVIKKQPNSVLLLIGEGELQASIRNLVSQLKLEDYIYFLGARGNISDILQAFDVFVFPSLFEGLPVTLIEAQASGLKIIASDVITKEVKLTDIIDFESIQSSPEHWANKILEHSKSYKRNNTQKLIVDAGYDISSTVNWLENFYPNLKI